MSYSSTPLVSIVIPVYNGSNYLTAAIDSALAQTYQNIEIIVVNDGSNDQGATENIANSYGDQIRYFYKENGGVATALNLAIKKMQGEFFSWLSHDDVYYPDKIDTQIKFIEQHNRHKIILYSNFNFIDSEGRYLNTFKAKSFPAADFKYKLIMYHPVNGCTVLIPKLLFSKIGLFNEALKSTQDTDMWYRLCQVASFVHLDQILVKSRLHPDQDSQKKMKLHYQECNEFFIKYLDDFAKDADSFVNDRARFKFYLNMAYHCAKGRRVVAAKYALDLAKYYPLKYFSGYYWFNKVYLLYRYYQWGAYN